jgi:hypothetical protein
MVDPDADKTLSIHSNDSIIVQRNIPASCQKHTIETSRSVRPNVFYTYTHIIDLQ